MKSKKLETRRIRQQLKQKREASQPLIKKGYKKALSLGSAAFQASRAVWKAYQEGLLLQNLKEYSKKIAADARQTLTSVLSQAYQEGQLNPVHFQRLALLHYYSGRQKIRESCQATRRRIYLRWRHYRRRAINVAEATKEVVKCAVRGPVDVFKPLVDFVIVETGATARVLYDYSSPKIAKMASAVHNFVTDPFIFFSLILFLRLMTSFVHHIEEVDQSLDYGNFSQCKPLAKVSYGSWVASKEVRESEDVHVPETEVCFSEVDICYLGETNSTMGWTYPDLAAPLSTTEDRPAVEDICYPETGNMCYPSEANSTVPLTFTEKDSTILPSADEDPMPEDICHPLATNMCYPSEANSTLIQEKEFIFGTHEDVLIPEDICYPLALPEESLPEDVCHPLATNMCYLYEANSTIPLTITEGDSTILTSADEASIPEDICHPLATSMCYPSEANSTLYASQDEEAAVEPLPQDLLPEDICYPLADDMCYPAEANSTEIHEEESIFRTIEEVAVLKAVPEESIPKDVCHPLATNMCYPSEANSTIYSEEVSSTFPQIEETVMPENICYPPAFDMCFPAEANSTTLYGVQDEEVALDPLPEDVLPEDICHPLVSDMCYPAEANSTTVPSKSHEQPEVVISDDVCLTLALMCHPDEFNSTVFLMKEFATEDVTADYTTSSSIPQIVEDTCFISFNAMCYPSEANSTVSLRQESIPKQLLAPSILHIPEDLCLPMKTGLCYNTTAYFASFSTSTALGHPFPTVNTALAPISYDAPTEEYCYHSSMIQGSALMVSPSTALTSISDECTLEFWLS
ncbi:hypothetical protein QR680_003623 [Steinernema hermaphroditum]|uniref:Uncharacterized protein n=1 Tax=Steinernema hermaphroditum TaxID=289476 RepID=A0AA39HMC6_9BILA|nr:hypothetical protein QR680_003623 [Steinernema hermaphroditum]